MDEKLKTKYLKDIEYFSKKLEDEPKSKVFMPLAMAYLKLEKYDEAIEIASNGLDLNPEYLAAKTLLAEAFLGKGMLNEAKGLLVEVAAFSESNYKAQKYLGEIYRIEGNMEKALYYYRSASLSAPEDYELRGLIDELANMVDATPKTIEEIESEEVKLHSNTNEEPSVTPPESKTLEEMATTLASDIIDKGLDDTTEISETGEISDIVEISDIGEDIVEDLPIEGLPVEDSSVEISDDIMGDIMGDFTEEFNQELSVEIIEEIPENPEEDVMESSLSEDLTLNVDNGFEDKDVSEKAEELFGDSGENAYPEPIPEEKKLPEISDLDINTANEGVIINDEIMADSLVERSSNSDREAIDRLEMWLKNISKSKETRHV